MTRSFMKLAGLVLVLLVLVGVLVVISMVMPSDPIGTVLWGAAIVVGVPTLIYIYRRNR